MTGASGDLTPEQRAVRRRRLAEVFGDVLPDQTGDDADGASDRGSVERAREDQLRRDVPPHHG